MEHSKLHILEAPSALQTTGLVVFTISMAVAGALFLDRFFARDVEVPLFLFAVASSAWYGRTTGAVLALVLCCLTFDYFFVQPLHSLYISSSDLPSFAITESAST
jgi:K+-sensing histidine kinase KdpD